MLVEVGGGGAGEIGEPLRDSKEKNGKGKGKGMGGGGVSKDEQSIEGSTTS